MLTICGRDYFPDVQLVMWAVAEPGLAHRRLKGRPDHVAHAMKSFEMLRGVDRDAG